MSKIGYSPSLPLVYTNESGPYDMLNTLSGIIKQNLKMLLLTSPGERIMMPDYGVGLKDYLFEHNTLTTIDDIKNKIIQQVDIFMPFLENIDISVQNGNPEESNNISVIVSYFVGPIEKQGYVELVLSPSISTSGEINSILDQKI
tara:strand:- start:3058 stop:3492 length:435 start_codon:yes stop_codon:yes gene_type:complete